MRLSTRVTELKRYSVTTVKQCGESPRMLHSHFTLADDRVSICRMIVPLKKVQLRQDEDGVWIAKSTLLPGCHAHGRDRGEALLRFQQAAKAHLEALLETGRPIPPPFRDKFILAA